MKKYLVFNIIGFFAILLTMSNLSFEVKAETNEDIPLEIGMETDNLDDNINEEDDFLDLEDEFMEEEIILMDEETIEETIEEEVDIPSNNTNGNETIVLEDEETEDVIDTEEDSLNIEMEKALEMEQDELEKEEIIKIQNIAKRSKKPTRIYTSLMFSEQNIKDIFAALPSSSTGIPDQYASSGISTSTDTGTQAPQTVFRKTSLYFYLNSIMYISQNSWSVWVNGAKITNIFNPLKDLVVLEISPLYVKLQWKATMVQWDMIAKDNSINENQYEKTEEGAYISFILSPNQTYFPFLNKIMEGNIGRILDKKYENMTNTTNNNIPQNINEEEIRAGDELFF